MPEATSSKRAQAPKRRFAKIFDGPGSDRLEWLLAMEQGGKTARQLWLYLYRKADHHNAVIASLDTLADELGCHTRSVARAAKDLEKAGAIWILKVGTARAYILNPNEVMRSADIQRKHISFGAMALIGFKENATIASRIRILQRAKLPPEADAANASPTSDSRSVHVAADDVPF